MNIVEELKFRLRPDPGSVMIGKILDSPFCYERLTDRQLNHHVQIVGASGYGKTVLLSHFMRDRIQKKKGVLFLDLKADLETINRFKAYAKGCGRSDDVCIFSLSGIAGTIAYNPVAQGTANQIRDRIIMSLIWSEEFYKNQAGSFLLKLLIGLCYLRDQLAKPFDIATILECSTDPEYLASLSQQIPESKFKEKKALEDCYSLLTSNDGHKSLQGLRVQLESLVLSDFGDLLTTNEAAIDLFEAVKQKKIIMMFLDSRRYGDSAISIGKLILQDLKAVTARIDAEIPERERIPFTVMIDEFADFAQEDFIAFLDRARSSKFGSVICHQEVSDLNKVSPEFAARLMGNTSTLYCFLQKSPESAELISGMAGTKRVQKETNQSSKLFLFDLPTGNKSLREVEEFNIHPNAIKSLRVGQCICIKKYPIARSYKVKINAL